MAKNLHMQEALKLSLPVPEGTKSGDPVKVGAFVGVAVTDRGDGGNAATHATVWRHGSWNLSVTGAISNIGDPVYITAAGAITATESGNSLFGHALATKTAAAAVIPVALAQV